MRNLRKPNRPMAILLPLLISTTTIATSYAHEGHSHKHRPAMSPSPNNTSRFITISTDGDGNGFSTDKQTFHWKHRSDLGTQPDAMIEAARTGLHNNADIDPKTGELITVVKDYGLVALDSELKAWTLIEDQDQHFAAGMNAHGMDCFEFDGQVLYAAASTNTREIVISNRGKIVARLGSPTGKEFDNPTANQYYANGGPFVPCDVVWLPEAKRLVVVTGYSPGDFAVSAERIDGTWQWSGPAFGGKQSEGGPFNTAHGMEVKQVDGLETIEVASRGHGRIYGFTPSGAMIRLKGANNGYYVQLPDRSTPCNLSFVDDKSFVPLLNSLPDTGGVAPVLVLQNNELIGSLIPATYDGLGFMHHMHGLKAFDRNGKLYAVALSWPDGNKDKRNDGQIAIFEAVPENPVQ
ncbi:hypothetical protein CA13_69390 [Planctomycetes bacterium CA13]|uniref:Phytase-like domain-containing protein n=1 Tax=Novipirellula herctigrandis TaxID=2527986 RepID=A0A5C5YNJ7_9BACT|nr:hypothetical protein CA13_69390 [Planctomycetes bacterium CA13]